MNMLLDACTPTYVIATTGVINLTLLLMIFTIYITKWREERDRKRMILLKSQHEKALMTARLRIQELTFQVISREIHDNVNHNLVVAKKQLDTIDIINNEAAIQIIRSSSSLIDESIDSLNKISKALDTKLIKGLGLPKALSTEAERINKSGLFTVNANFSGTIRQMSENKEREIFRIVQEAFSNVIKHANAEVVDLSLNYLPQHVELKITDNGVGFQYSSEQKIERSSGINNMKVRTYLLKGKAKINSVPGQGTSISISIPYDDAILKA